MKTEELKEIHKIISRHIELNGNGAFIFGSRSRNDFMRKSDLDIAIDIGERVPWSTLSLIEMDFENSDLPYRVDLVDFAAVDEQFSKIARKNIIKL